MPAVGGLICGRPQPGIAGHSRYVTPRNRVTGSRDHASPGERPVGQHRDGGRDQRRPLGDQGDLRASHPAHGHGADTGLRLQSTEQVLASRAGLAQVAQLPTELAGEVEQRPQRARGDGQGADIGGRSALAFSVRSASGGNLATRGVARREEPSSDAGRVVR